MRKWLLFAGAAVVGVTVLVGHALTQGDKTAVGTVPQKSAKSRIAKVTVYPNSALVTREVEVPEGTGLTELVVANLPVRVLVNSLYSEGTDGIRVLSMRFRTQEVFEDTREDVRKLEDEAKTLRLAAEKLSSEIATLRQNMMMLTKLEDFTAKTTVHSTEKGGLNSDTVITLTTYLMKQRDEKARELVKLDQDLQRNKEQVEFCKRQMSQLSRGTSKTERDAVIVIDRDQSVKGAKVRLNYLVDAVSWKPQYKLRAGKNGESVQIDYLASLVQHSGENWNQVALALSTAEPMLNAAPPDLGKLEIVVVDRAGVPIADKRRGDLFARPTAPKADLDKAVAGLRKMAKESYGKGEAKGGEQALNSAAALVQNDELMKTREQIQDENRRQDKGKSFEPGLGAGDGPSVTYILGPRLSVPSRNDEQVVEVAKLKLEPKFYFKAVPVLSRSVYRLADLVNKSELVLLPGEATMYQGTDFVGRMRLPLVAVGEEFTAGFGVDPQLQVQRQMLDKERKTQGGNQVLKYEYRILVSSYKKDKVAVQIWDRLPHSGETEAANVILAKSSPELSKDKLYEREQRPSNLLRWDLELEPGMSGEHALAIHYEFRLELDKMKVIQNVLSR